MLIIDRIEKDTAVVETPDGHIDVPVSKIDGKARDGAVLIENGSGTYTVDEAETKSRADKAKVRTKSLFS